MAADSRVGAVVEEKHQEMARSFHGRLRDCCECSDPFEAEAHIACSACVALALAFAEFGAEVREETWPRACREERARLVRIANSFGAGHALAAIGFARCPERHPGTDQRCLLGLGHVRDDGYSIHQSENVTWPTLRAPSGETPRAQEEKP
jgi:hypothetical protein